MFTIIALDHIVLNVADVDRALSFYADGLGLRVERLEAYRRGEVKFPSVRISAETIVDLFPPSMHGGASTNGANMNHLCLVTSGSPDETRERLERIGAPVDQGPVTVFGARGEGVSYYTRDHDGNVVELRSYPS